MDPDPEEDKDWKIPDLAKCPASGWIRIRPSLVDERSMVKS
jgi:hypothetical protein